MLASQKKDLYNHVDVDRRVHLRYGDAEGALAYLCGKSKMDPSFYYKYNVDEDNRLGNLFWADSTNAMNNKKPFSVITDGDKVMHKAIKRIFPNSCHQLCAWHIQHNAFTNVHVKDFTNHFSKCLFTEDTVEEFECAWNDMLEMFNLHGHKDEMKNAELFFLASTENHRGYCVHTLTKFRSPDKIWKIEHLEEIPESCIMKRWSKLAKKTIQVHHDNESQGDPINIIQYGALSSMCSRMSYFGSQSKKAFKEARCEIQRLTCQMEELCKNSAEEGEREDLKATKHHVRDPIIVKMKGNPGTLKD
ncbi:hypothetical protein CK203_086249 [Vitis vinifera]|uniref:MULE transposase domain-containing protein n=1 Tax=Vitis vinifera TaxID=29760 RepID=A0A438EEC6_VITVI|nr:hypothetical protein CK203_086249 [Vitis vinifera]